MNIRYRQVLGTIRLIHVFPTAVVVVTSLFLILIVHGGNPGRGFMLRAGSVVLLSQIAVGALNDYVDRELDAQLQPDKPIPSALVSPALALGLVIVSLILIVPAGLTFGTGAFAVAAIGTFAGLAYDLWLKPTPLSFLGYIGGFLSLLTWVWLVAGHFSLWLVPLYPAAVLLLVAAHLAQSLPDIETDRTVGLHGLAVVLGPARSVRIIEMFYLVAALGGLGVAALARSVSAFGLVVLSMGVLAFARRLEPERPHSRARRVRFFHAIAAGIALQGLGSLLAITSLG